MKAMEIECSPVKSFIALKHNIESFIALTLGAAIFSVLVGDANRVVLTADVISNVSGEDCLL
jgi:regulator of extracellular matrix RemA (YlzA/DUF370 family)